MSNRGTLQFLVQLFLTSIECIVYFSDFVCQVAALNFGDFYNVQYVNMYTIFIGQLRVNYSSPCVIFFIFFVFWSTSCLSWLLAWWSILVFLFADNSPTDYKYPWGIFKRKWWRTSKYFLCTWFQGRPLIWKRVKVLTVCILCHLKAFIQNLALFFTSFFKVNLFLCWVRYLMLGLWNSAYV